MATEDRTGFGVDQSRGGRVATFYSYKGGLGRTLAVAGTASALASRHGKKVLAIDWDLETPDLHTALGRDDDWSRGHPGLLDYLRESRVEFRHLQDHGSETSARRSVRLEEFVETVLSAGSGAPGRVDLLSAGNLGSGYLQRMESLNWRDLYAYEGGFWIMERLRLQAAETYDFILIDARAGRSGTSFVPLLQLADLAVLVFAPNGSNDAATSAILASIAGHRRTNRQSPTVMMVPSLLTSGMSPEALGRRMDDMAHRISGASLRLPEFARDPMAFALPYDETLAAGRDRGSAALASTGPELTAAYGRIADAMAKLPPDAGEGRKARLAD